MTLLGMTVTLCTIVLLGTVMFFGAVVLQRRQLNCLRELAFAGLQRATKAATASRRAQSMTFRTRLGTTTLAGSSATML